MRPIRTTPLTRTALPGLLALATAAALLTGCSNGGTDDTRDARSGASSRAPDTGQ